MKKYINFAGFQFKIILNKVSFLTVRLLDVHVLIPFKQDLLKIAIKSYNMSHLSYLYTPFKFLSYFFTPISPEN